MNQISSIRSRALQENQASFFRVTFCFELKASLLITQTGSQGIDKSLQRCEFGYFKKSYPSGRKDLSPLRIVNRTRCRLYRQFQKRKSPSAPITRSAPGRRMMSSSCLCLQSLAQYPSQKWLYRLASAPSHRVPRGTPPSVPYFAATILKFLTL